MKKGFSGVENGQKSGKNKGGSADACNITPTLITTPTELPEGIMTANQSIHTCARCKHSKLADQFHKNTHYYNQAVKNVQMALTAATDEQRSMFETASEEPIFVESQP